MQLGLVDGVVTEDSDALLFGANTVYKNIFNDKKYVEVRSLYHIYTLSILSVVSWYALKVRWTQLSYVVPLCCLNSPLYTHAL